jgi:hypothetical protein
MKIHTVRKGQTLLTQSISHKMKKETTALNKVLQERKRLKYWPMILTITKKTTRWRESHHLKVTENRRKRRMIKLILPRILT